MAGNANPSNQKRQSPSINLPWTESDQRHPLRDFEDVERRFREMGSRLDENWWYINRITFSAQGGGRWATIVIAASDTDLAGKAFADYVCSGAGDQTTINQAITILQARGTPGRIVLLEGTYALSDSITVSALGSKQLSIVGMGGSGAQPTASLGNTVLNGTGLGSSPTINVLGSTSGLGTSVSIRDLTIKHTGGTGGCIKVLDATVEVRGCFLQYAGTSLYAINQNSTLGSDDNTFIVENTISSTGSGGGGVLVTTGPSPANGSVIVAHNYIRFNGAGVGVEVLNKGTSSRVIGNDVRGSSNASGSCIRLDGNSQADFAIANNVCTTAQYGLEVAGTGGGVVTGNQVDACNTGFKTRPFELDNALIAANNFMGCTTGVNLDNGVTQNTVAFNRISASGTAVIVGSNCVNTGVFYNDTYGASTALSDGGTGTRTEGWFLTASSLPSHHTTHETGGADAITGNVDGNARVGVRKNTTGSTFKRRRLNLIEGANVALTIGDDSTNEEVDVTIAVSGIAGTTTFKNNGSTVGAESTLNVIPGSNITIGMTDTGTEIDLTISAAAGPGNSGKVFNYMAFK